jgi:hypothetical protein
MRPPPFLSWTMKKEIFPHEGCSSPCTKKSKHRDVSCLSVQGFCITKNVYP